MRWPGKIAMLVVIWWLVAGFFASGGRFGTRRMRDVDAFALSAVLVFGAALAVWLNAG